MIHAALLLKERVDGSQLGQDLRSALNIIRELRESNPSLTSWINFPIVNNDGNSRTIAAVPYVGEARETNYSASFPYVRTLLARLREAGLRILHVRIAALMPRDVLRPHVDTHQTIRLLVPLNEHRDDFRHLVRNRCIRMRVGDIWQINGQVCHGAANMNNFTKRIMLIIDGAPDSRVPKHWYTSIASVSKDRTLRRKRWGSKERLWVRQQAYVHAIRGEETEAEKRWLMAPFEFQVSAESMYADLFKFSANMAEILLCKSDRRRWAARARHMLHSRLPFEIEIKV